ncbi:type IV pilus biogenesis/stability protein PilW [Marinimicrobium alkaliphilum]|uniref:type IV pilus biogenesis/stability protein PilW n=1 Tax=Marinimicrobium alkaliphilum TaxID=2202654 RepID=UPI000DB91DE8|nr:type IV pilus biogenesis/stability protein PilW [Marinimicrobium alkaliphilum]
MVSTTRVWWTLLLALVLVSGCVTTDGNSRTHVDKDRALENHIQLAYAYIESGNRESARHHLRRAFDIDRRSPDAMGAMAMLYQLEGEPELAEEYFRRTLRRDRDHTRTRNNFGVFLFGQGRYQDAYEELERVVQDLDYDNRARALVNLGRSALHLGNTERAESAFRHAHVLDRSLPSAMIELADLYFQKEDYAESKRFLDLFAERANHSPRSLWLGIRIEQIFGNEDQEASYALALRNRYPYSREHLEYIQSKEQ